MDGLMDLKAETVKSSETETLPLRRWLSLDTSVGYKGLTVMTIMTGLSILSWLLAKNHVMMQNYFAIESSEITSSEALTQAQIEKLIAPQFLNSTTESEDLAKIDDILDISDHVPLMAAGDDMDQVTVVHYIWCGNRFLDFRHYIAIKSTIQAVRPDRVLFHYHRLPMHDTDGYFTWFELLLQTFDNILLLNVNKTSQRECRANGAERFLLVLDVLEKYGGMYMPEEAIFLRVPPRHLTKSFVSGVGSCTLRFFSEGIVMAKKDNFSLPQTEEALLKMISNCHGDQEGLRPCTQEKRFMENTDSRPSCIRLETTLFPKDVWGSYDRLSNLTKLVAYGKTDVRPKRSILAADRTPRIAHYLCTDDCVLTFGMYVSILSALHVGDLYRVVVHGPKTPTGIWWKRLQQQEAGNVLYLHREFPLSAVEPGHPVTYEVGRYIMRTQILMQYGGVFHDSHVIWTQRLPDEMMEYEVVASPDWHNLGNWPESMNHGLLIARHSARYLQQLLKIYYANDGMVLPWVTDHYLSYRLIELDPTLVYLHSHLQVKCLNNNCHPTWQPDFRSHFMQNRPGLSFDWRRETMSIHWLDSRSALDVDKIKFASGIIVEVTRYILTSAGVSLESL